MSHLIDPVALSRALIRCNSVTPKEGGALKLLEAELSAHGFSCERVDRGGIANLFSRWGAKKHPKTFGFSGHTDVVPPGDENSWHFPPFDAAVQDGILYGRGAADMKSGVAAFVSAAVSCAAQKPDGAIVLLIAGDEEGKARDGTCALLDWMQKKGEKMSLCLVGEPTCPEKLGDMIKIGRRGSMTAYFEVSGTQGHTAYPQRALNPLPPLAMLVSALAETPLDSGSAHFEPSSLALTTIDTNNLANNVIPGTARFTANIRFNDLHNSANLTDWLGQEARKIEAQTGVTISFETSVSGESFFTPPGALSTLISEAITAETGLEPKLSTSGGTSDARFIKNHCPVAEFGIVGQTMHKIDECVAIADIPRLAEIYNRILTCYFK